MQAGHRDRKISIEPMASAESVAVWVYKLPDGMRKTRSSSGVFAQHAVVRGELQLLSHGSSRVEIETDDPLPDIR